MDKEEDKEEEIIKNVSNHIKEIIKVEGPITKYSIIGNGIYIRFQNGTSYIQPLISKHIDGVTLDKSK